MEWKNVFRIRGWSCRRQARPRWPQLDEIRNEIEQAALFGHKMVKVWRLCCLFPSTSGRHGLWLGLNPSSMFSVVHGSCGGTPLCGARCVEALITQNEARKNTGMCFCL